MLCSITSASIIKCFDSHFTRYGVPVGLRTDTGFNFLSEEMEKYLERMGIVHRHNTRLWPRANGEVKRENRSLLKATKIFPSRRERLAPGTEQVFVALSINKSQDNTCQPG